MNKFLIIFVICIVNLITILKKIFRRKVKDEIKVTIGARHDDKPIFKSSFIQKWYAKDFSLERWIEELRMLQNVGIEEIILQSIVDTKNKEAVYNTLLEGFVSSENDMIKSALDAAEYIGIKVRVGLGESEDWWEKGWYDFKWLSEEADINKKIVNEILGKYGDHKAFGGWYIPYEFSEFFITTKSQQINLNLFYKSIAEEIKSKNKNFSIMIAPFFSSNRFKIGSVGLWKKIIQNVLVDTSIDIVSLQDSIGVGYNTFENVSALFYYTKQATDALGITLYADIETFDSTEKGNIPVDLKKILKQMSEVYCYVDGFVAFSINHFQNKNEENQIGNYNNYLEYYNKIKIEELFEKITQNI
ncbi:DUF4434 domain-containing protein [Clostridium chromiireducens]|uniref:DUF4434 domain-containing protein n=1 Tax=Clostridium chromiireducens TaxID=225345 RepID=A0A399IL53_9CLOT|nr:DUF4434 domain-containing protein [Clostridium chromiireducens]RII33834.1 DUF4434 domain-containing protein [Clostridium chromiireducens]